MTTFDFVIKRVFDISVSIVALAIVWPIIFVAWVVTTCNSGTNGFFRQERVGRNGALFKVNKLRTMAPIQGTTVTVSNDPRITPFGAKLRQYKIDELPQLWNVLIGEMSLVGPRPDVPGFMDELEGDDRKLLMLRPGITGPASLKYRDEENILNNVKDPERYNAEVIWPDKVQINLDYLNNWSFMGDIKYIYRTVVG